MKFHKNTIIALAVLAVFVVCVSIAKVSLANPFSSKETPTPQPTEETASEAVSIQDGQVRETLAAGDYVDLHQNSVTTAANRPPNTTSQQSARYFVDFDEVFKHDNVFAVFDNGGLRYLSWLLRIMAFDNSSETLLTAYSYDVYPPIGEYYSEDSAPSMDPVVRWLLKNSVPYLTLDEVRASLTAQGYADATLVMELDMYFATQLAIWSQMNGIAATDWQFAMTSTILPLIGDKYPQVGPLYTHIMANLGSDAVATPNVQLIVEPAPNMTYTRRQLGPFVLRAENLLPQDANATYTVNLMADRQGLEALVVDEHSKPLTSLSNNQQFYIRITNYDSLPGYTTYRIKIVAQTLTPVNILREGMLTTNDVTYDFTTQRDIACANLVYAYRSGDILKGSFMFDFVTPDMDTK